MDATPIGDGMNVVDVEEACLLLLDTTLIS